MHGRSKVFMIESVVVMLVLIFFAFGIFIIIDAGAKAYHTIISEKEATENARVAYSHINVKVKQNDAADSVELVKTEFGSTVRIYIKDTEYVSYIFVSGGVLYECTVAKETKPTVEAANKITDVDAFEADLEGGMLHVMFLCGSRGAQRVMEGIIGLRS